MGGLLVSGIGRLTCPKCSVSWPCVGRHLIPILWPQQLGRSSRGKEKGNGKGDIAVGPLGRKPPPTVGNVLPTIRKPQVVPPRGPLGAGVGVPPTPETPPSPPSEELVKALQLLQSVLTPEDFAKHEKK